MLEVLQFIDSDHGSVVGTIEIDLKDHVHGEG